MISPLTLLVRGKSKFSHLEPLLNWDNWQLCVQPANWPNAIWQIHFAIGTNIFVEFRQIQFTILVNIFHIWTNISCNWQLHVQLLQFTSCNLTCSTSLKCHSFQSCPAISPSTFEQSKSCWKQQWVQWNDWGKSVLQFNWKLKWVFHHWIRCLLISASVILLKTSFLPWKCTLHEHRL